MRQKQGGRVPVVGVAGNRRLVAALGPPLHWTNPRLGLFLTRLFVRVSQKQSQSRWRGTITKPQWVFAAGILLGDCGCGESFDLMKKFGLDSTDIRILSAIQQYGPLSKAKLAEIANISATPCWARLDRLKAAGFIRGYHAEIALERITDFTHVVVTLSLTHHRKADFDRFEAVIRNLDEVTDCVATGGGMDYVMETITPDLASFQALMDTLLGAELGIDRYMTYIATRRVKSSKPNLAKLAAKGRI